MRTFDQEPLSLSVEQRDTLEALLAHRPRQPPPRRLALGVLRSIADWRTDGPDWSRAGRASARTCPELASLRPLRPLRPLRLRAARSGVPGRAVSAQRRSVSGPGPPKAPPLRESPEPSATPGGGLPPHGHS